MGDLDKYIVFCWFLLQQYVSVAEVNICFILYMYINNEHIMHFKILDKQ